MKTQNEQTKLLWKELESENPSESKIRELVAQGADISGDFLKDAIKALSPPSDMWEVRRYPIDSKFFQLLIELGADVNYEDDDDTGYNSLFEAALCWNVEVTEILLKAGADPNSTSSEMNESILSYVSFDQYYETECMDRGGSEPLAKIEALIEQYGGKCWRELFVDKVQKFLKIDDEYVCGLITRKGNIRIENIPGTDEKLIQDFNQWIDSRHKNWKIKRIRKPNNDDEFAWVDTPVASALIQHNKIGLEIAGRIKLLVGKEIEVEYMYLNPLGIESLKTIVESVIIGEDGSPVPNVIIVSDYFENGLLKNDVGTTIHSIARGDSELIHEFMQWVDDSRELLQPFQYTVGMMRLLPPKVGELKQHNKKGFELAKRIKAITDEYYKVYYSCVNCELL